MHAPIDEFAQDLGVPWHDNMVERLVPARNSVPNPRKSRKVTREQRKSKRKAAKKARRKSRK